MKYLKNVIPLLILSIPVALAVVIVGMLTLNPISLFIILIVYFIIIKKQNLKHPMMIFLFAIIFGIAIGRLSFFVPLITVGFLSPDKAVVSIFDLIIGGSLILFAIVSLRVLFVNMKKVNVNPRHVYVSILSSVILMNIFSLIIHNVSYISMFMFYMIISSVAGLIIGGYFMIPFLGREKGQREYGQDMGFLPVPDSPNCVMSTLDEDHEKHVSPLEISETQYDTAIGFIKDIMVTDFGAQVLYDNDHYLHTTVQTSLMRYVDDVEFIWDQEKQILHVRSCSRLGHSDMGANRARVEQIRDRISQRSK